MGTQEQKGGNRVKTAFVTGVGSRRDTKIHNRETTERTTENKLMRNLTEFYRAQKTKHNS